MTTVASSHCETPRTYLEVGGRSRLVPSSVQKQGPRLTVRVGDDIRLRAEGNCAQDVSATPQNSRLRAVEEPGNPDGAARLYRATRTGVVRLVISMPMCALPANSASELPCNGGIRQLGTALVKVIPAAE